ncbi:hypothetical protein [Coleofasciculus sp. E1-EBD-02]|uniref:hypothetical protein n=1 Tax=Coleofasciculus sp. E1-EBD-02 TaxID=3068481 RepID=UPI0032F4D69A
MHKIFCSNYTTKHPALSCFVRSHNLTDCLDWIEENIGVTGDAAILIISLLNLTAGGVA